MPGDVFDHLDETVAVAFHRALVRARIVVAGEKPGGVDAVIANDGEEDVHRGSR